MRIRYSSLTNWLGPLRAFMVANVLMGCLAGLSLIPIPATATAVTDNFNRPDGALGANWTTVTGTAAPAISSNQLIAGTPGTANSAFWSADTFNANQYAQGNFTTPEVSGQYGPGIAVRLTTAGTGYFLWYGSADNTVSIWRLDGPSSWTELAGSAVLTISTTDTWRIEAVGAYLTAYQNGNEVIQTTDDHYSGGSPGVWLYNTSNYLDNWAGGDTSQSYALGGTISGLNGTVVLQDNGGSSLNISNNGQFTFNAVLPDGTPFNVTVGTQPAGQVCTVQNGADTLQGADYTGVAVTCTGSPPTVSGSDNFNRADGPLGPNWADISDGGMTISGQAIAGATPGVNSGDMRTAETYPTDQYSQIDVGTVSGGDWVGPAVRMSGAGQNLYLGLYSANNGSPYLQIFRRASGGWTGISGQYACGTLPAGTQLKLEVVGSALALLENGVERESASDPTLPTGAPGVMAYGVPTADNFQAGNQGFEVHYLSTDANGVETYDMLSPMNNYGPQLLKVLRPTSPTPGVPHNIIYTLPVVAGTDTGFGDGLATLQSLNAQNQYNLTIVEPLFGVEPWYADNPNDPGARQESFMTSELVPWVNANLKTSGTEQSWLMGFSKSGIGAMDLFLKHPDLFSLVAAWDWPADNNNYAEYGVSSQNVYGTDANFQANYRLTQSFLEAHHAPLMAHNRIWIGSFEAFANDVADFDSALTGFNIPHTTETPTYMLHRWDSGWVPLALAALSADSPALIPPSPTPTPTQPPTTSPTPSATPMQTPTATAASRTTPIPSQRPTPAPASTPTPSASPASTPTPSAQPSATATPLATPLPETSQSQPTSFLGITSMALGLGTIVIIVISVLTVIFIRRRATRPPF